MPAVTGATGASGTGAPLVSPGPFLNVPNVLTTARTVAAVGLGVWALVDASLAFLIAAYLVYWLGDIADGVAARVLGQETRVGAVYDIVCDRASSAVLCAGLLIHQPDLWPAVAVFLLQFMALDCLLSLAFLCWPIDTPNDFAAVDRPVYRWNWSPPAKGINTAGVVLAVVLGSLPLALTVAVAQVVVKAWSAHRVVGLLTGRLQPRPAPSLG